jgi:hypothetical protein
MQIPLCCLVIVSTFLPQHILQTILDIENSYYYACTQTYSASRILKCILQIVPCRLTINTMFTHINVSNKCTLNFNSDWIDSFYVVATLTLSSEIPLQWRTSPTPNVVKDDEDSVRPNGTVMYSIYIIHYSLWSENNSCTCSQFCLRWLRGDNGPNNELSTFWTITLKLPNWLRTVLPETHFTYITQYFTVAAACCVRIRC